MVKTHEAGFAGAVLRPSEHLELESNNSNAHDRRGLPEEALAARASLETTPGLNLDGPADWSE